MFGRKKKKQSKDMTYFYLDALKNKQIPVLVLDPKWHELFPDFRKTDKIKKLEEHLLDLIKQQGQSSNDLKEYEKAKKVVMENIVNNMTCLLYTSPINIIKRFMIKKERIYDKTERDGKDCF